MPELPEVETTVRGLRRTIVGLTIKNVWTDLASQNKRTEDAVANPKFFKFFKSKILGSKVTSVERRAKNILITLESTQTILVHLKMTGHLLYGKYKFVKNRWVPDEAGPLHDPYNRFVHVVFTFTSPRPSPYKGEGETHLAFSDARKFGKITLLDTATLHESKHLKNLG